MNWPIDKHIICSINNDIPVTIPSSPYVLLNRSVLCNYGIEAENSYILESLAACHDSNSKLVMYFTVNTAFVNYLDQMDNLTDTLEFRILKNKTTYEQALPVSWNVSKCDSDLLMAPRTLKNFIHQYICKREIFALNERHDMRDKNLYLTKISFLTTS